MPQNPLQKAWDGRDDLLTRQIIGAAIEVHREMGPGLLEATYDECLCLELSLRGLSFERQIHLPIVYKSIQPVRAFKPDLVIEKEVILGIKTVEKLLPVHEAQLLTYLKLSRVRTGLLINFNTVPLKAGIRRLTNTQFSPVSPVSQARTSESGKERNERATAAAQSSTREY